MSECVIRTARPEDAEALLEIYAPYVLQTAVTFEYDVPSREEFTGRMEHILARYPYLAAWDGRRVLGDAYAGAFHPRAAYGWSVETTVYVRRDERRLGVGRALYTVLEQALAAQHVLNLNACIAFPPEEDAFLTMDSVRFHEKMGYRMAGHFHACGRKFDRWYDMVWMEKHLGPHTGHAADVVPFSQVRGQLGL